MGGFAHHLLEGFAGPPGPARPHKSVISWSGEGFCYALTRARLTGKSSTPCDQLKFVSFWMPRRLAKSTQMVLVRSSLSTGGRPRPFNPNASMHQKLLTSSSSRTSVWKNAITTSSVKTKLFFDDAAQNQRASSTHLVTNHDGDLGNVVL